ncbi:MAG: glucosaminidase domain-containing protein [Selenomonadales bacterium]|nr:glucosaminidase domain-containing protein [Selenomonadales bacterium]
MKQIKWDKEMVGLACGCICLIGAIGWSQYQHVTTEEVRPDSSVIINEELDRQKEMDKHIVRVTDRMMQLEQSLWMLGEKLPEIKQHMTAKNVRLEARTVAVGNGSRLVAQYLNKPTTQRSSTFDVTMPSLVTAYEIDMILAESPLAGLGRAFVEAEAESKVNAMFLLALAVHESNWGSSVLAREKNNLFGFGAYDSNPYHGAKVFASKEECVKHVARFLREHYLEGVYYRGTTIQNINQTYASDRAWGEKIFATMTRLDSKIQNLGLSE